MTPKVTTALSKCRVCHGKDLAGKRQVPAIAGMKKRRVQKALGAQPPRPMRPIVLRLSDADKASIAHYISKLPKPEAKPTK